MEAGDRFVRVVSTCKNLHIPGDIALQMQGDDVILRDRYENLWYVGVTRSRDDQWYFEKGWSQFYKENSLELFDFVVFEYKGGKLFDFKVLGHDACDKKGVRHLKFEVKRENFDGGCYEVREEDITKSSHVCRRNLRGGGVAEAPGKRNYRKLKVTGKEGVGAETHDVKKDADEEKENITTSQSKSSSQAKKITYCSGRGTDWYGADIFKSGSVPRPRNPFFVTRSRTSNRENDLHIPKEVIEDYQLEIPERLFVMDEHDRKWGTKINVWKDGRVWCNKGWGGLCKANSIGKDDACICEFVKGEKLNDLCIKVRCVSRVG